MPVGIITAVGTAAASSALPLATGLLGVAETGLIGAGLGAGTSAIFGRDPGKGALLGGLGGLGEGLGPIVGDPLGIGTTAGDVLTGAGLGAVGGAITGTNPLKAALTGGAGGLAQGLISNAGSSGSTSPSGAPAAATGASGGGEAAASGIAAAGTPDLTAAVPTTGIASVGTGGPGAAPGPGTGAIATGPIENLTVTGNTGIGMTPEGFNFGNATAGAAGALAGSQIGNGSPEDPFGTTTPSPDARASTTTSLGPGTGAPAAKPSFGQQLKGDLLKPSTLLSLGGLAYEAATQPKLPDVSGLTTDLKNQADALAGQSTQLTNFLNTGLLPAGAQQIVNNATTAAKATIKSQYAKLGMSGSTSEATALAQVDQQAAAQIYKIGSDLVQTGLKEADISSTLYENILKVSDAQSQRMSSAISNFAAALAGGGRPLQLNLGTSTGSTAT